MGSVVELVNIGKGERIFRFVIGVALIALALFVSGISRWIVGLIGLAILPTAIFGY